MAVKAAKPQLAVYISKQYTAQALGVTERTIDNMIRDGRLPAYRIGRTVRLKLDEVEAALVPFGGASA
jgi:excisionase family DNA binding protein